jgi:hypothetical protein
MAMNWPRWIKREWARCALDAELGGAALGITPSPLREPLYSDIDAVWAFYVSRARDASRSVEIELNPSDSAAYNMARVVWLAGELASDSPVISGWRMSSARRRAFDRYNFTMVPLGRSVGLSVRVSRAVHGDAAWNIVRCKWLEAQVGHLVLSGASSAAAAPRTPAEAAVTGTVGPAVVLDWTNLTYGIEIECIRPSNVSMAEFARQLTEAGVPTNAEHYNHHVRNYWKIVTDGSLSDRNGVGMELVSPILKGTADFEMVRKAAAVLHGDGPRALCRINKTCGLHVHVGLPRREHTLPINVLRLYHHYESVIDGLMPPSRRGTANSYCRPTTFTPRMAGSTTLETLRSSYGYDRYRKVNLESIWRHGTVEFRQHAGTIEAEKIISWATLVLKMMAVANSAPPLPEGPATLEGLLALTGADEAATSFWMQRQSQMAPASMAAAA